ncbi:MAG: VOC family protein [Myxococcota bacterium]
MLTRIDRIQLAVPDRESASAGWTELLGAVPAGEDRVECLGASRSRYRLGRGFVELLEPAGAGPIADAVAKRGGHLYAAGAATHDLDALIDHLKAQGVEALREGNQAFIDPAASGTVGYRAVLSRDEDLPRVGAIDFLYEVTLLVAEARSAVERCSTLFGVDSGAFVPIDSPHFGYEGVLTLFDRERLHRFEVITPTDLGKTMGRFFSRFGESFYMAFAETDRLDEIERRARELGHRITVVSAPKHNDATDTIFVHPPALGGMMLGLSRPTLAWRWSGHPERVEAPQ